MPGEPYAFTPFTFGLGMDGLRPVHLEWKTDFFPLQTGETPMSVKMPWMLRRFVVSVLVALAAVIIVELIIALATGHSLQFWSFK